MGASHSEQEYLSSPEPLTEAQLREKHLIYETTQEAAELVRNHPPEFKHPHKRLVYDLAAKGITPVQGKIDITRWSAMPVTSEFPPPGVPRPKFSVAEDVFSYPPGLHDNVVEWHVNFADPSLFVAYGGGLFAQDEMQAAEMPILGSIRELLCIDTIKQAKTREGGRPTPILVSNVQRRVFVKTDRNAAAGRPFGLYGNAFSRASETAIRTATQLIDPPTVVNLICMASLAGGAGAYTRQQLTDLFFTIYSSFKAAVMESHRLVASPSGRCVIHTGNFGCGAFGGNLTVMSFLQLFSAWMAGVDELVYHSFDENGTRGYKNGLGLLDRFVSSLETPPKLPSSSPEAHSGDPEATVPEATVGNPTQPVQQGRTSTTSVAGILSAVEVMGLQWGVSDGN